MQSRFASALAAAALIIGLLAGEARAHEGDDHGTPAAAAPASVAARGEAASERFELVAVAQGAVLILYLDRFGSNEPVTNATIDVETPDGPAKAEAREDGTYRLAAPWLAKGGHIDFIVTVSADSTDDILPLALDVPTSAAKQDRGTAAHDVADRLRAVLTPNVVAAAFVGILIGVVAMTFGRRRRGVAMLLTGALLAIATPPSLAHEGHDHGQPQTASTAQGDIAKRLPDGSVFVPKAAQRIFALRTIVTQTGAHNRSTELPGRVIPDPNASGFVQAAIGGRLSPPPGGFPRLGTPVKAGDVLAYVTPPLQAIDVSDMRQKQGELDQQIAIAERRLARNESLAPSGAVARSQLEDSRTEVEGLKERRAMLDKSRREPEALIAPVSGIVADGTAVAGQMAQPNAVIFHIIDPAKLWIEGLSFDVIADTQEAFAKTATGKTFKVAYRGSGFADRSQSIPVHFAIEGDPAGLRAGQFVSVLVRTDEARPGIALPRSSLVRAANGQDIVYEHVTAEIFMPRAVRIAPLDGEHVLITAGLDAGKRIVTQAAELVDHVR